MLLQLVFIHYYFAYVVIYNSRGMVAYVCNMLLYIMYQSFLNCDWLCFDYLFEILILISFF